MSAAPDTEHEEWLQGEEERRKLHAHTHGPGWRPPEDGVKKAASVPDEDEAQEEVDDAADDAAEELLAEANQENSAGEGEV